MARALLARATFGRRSRQAQLYDLLVACRRSTSPWTRERLRVELEPYLIGNQTGVWREQEIGWARFTGSFGDISRKRELTTSLVLKAPGANGEKGVLYCSFEYNWMKLVVNHDCRALLDEYYVVGATSWSPTDFAALGNFAGMSTDPIFIGISHVTDNEAYRVMAPVVEPVPLMACDWINPGFYEPKPRGERSIDILMVANWLPFKRHWLLFEALRSMPADLRIVLVGRNAPGRTEKEILAEARALGVKQDLELLTNVDIKKVTELQCDARLALVCSQREGSCVAPAEALFADTPIALMDDAHVGVTAHVNERTGMLLSRRTMARQLTQMLEEGDRFDPRSWAVENISAFRSSERLNAQLRTHAERTGRPWTRDIAPICWRYVPTYIHEADRASLAGAVEQLRERHSVQLISYDSDQPPSAVTGSRSHTHPQ